MKDRLRNVSMSSSPACQSEEKKSGNLFLLQTAFLRSVSGAHAVFASVTEAVAALSDDSAIESIYIFGGSGIYSVHFSPRLSRGHVCSGCRSGGLQECIKSPLCNKIYYTDIEGTFEADAFFPRIDPDFYRLVR